MNRYYKNFILCGDINQYCLLCKESFYLIPDIEKHVRWEKHRKYVKEQVCLQQFQTDSIYKIQQNYYCLICNLVMKDVDSVKDHIKDAKHKLLKEKPDAIIKKPVGILDVSYIIINKIKINKLQWHSIIDNKCHICTMDLENIDNHIASDEHMIGLIQCESKYADNQYYRKINDEKYHCFVCKKIFSTISFDEHWTQCENNNTEIKQLQETSSVSNDMDAAESSSTMAGIEKELIEILKQHCAIDETKNVAACKHCQKTIPINFRSFMEHMKEYHSGRYRGDSSEESSEDEVIDKGVPDSGLQRLELARYGEKLYIKLNHNGSRGYCKFCDKYISAHKTQFKLHCKGMTHRGYLEIVGLKKAKLREISSFYHWQSFKSYLLSIQNSTSESAFWINNQFCVDIDSLFFIYPIQGDPHYNKIKCHACVDVLNPNDVHNHCLSMKHRVLFSAAKVICKDGEFIREVRPYLYHCGFCNLTFPYSKVLEDHLKTKKHILSKEKKTLVSKVVKFMRNFNPNSIDVTASDDDFYTEMLQLAGKIGSSLIINKK